jgi:hypothetical protein
LLLGKRSEALLIGLTFCRSAVLSLPNITLSFAETISAGCAAQRGTIAVTSRRVVTHYLPPGIAGNAVIAENAVNRDAKR